MLTIYPAIFHEEDGTFWVEFPDLEGCQTCGATLEETMALAQEALGLYIVSLKESKREIPTATDVKNLVSPEGAFTTLVSCDIDNYRRKTKSIKKTLSIPEWLNEEAEKRHINFSSVLRNALEQELAK
ncbi:MAG TPA: HicB family protein [Clostridiaceae bacterium]|jgi:antitoxin HicB|nr:HicB family protein [Clostridiaceae bacterium]